MAWTSPRTWTTGELVTAALMNTHVRDNLSYLYTLAATPLTVKTVVVGESPYTAAGYNVILCNTAGGAIEVDLPAVRVIGPDEIARYDPAGLAFHNINTPEELKKAEEMGE